jgi:hypothetical protein
MSQIGVHHGEKKPFPKSGEEHLQLILAGLDRDMQNWQANLQSVMATMIVEEDILHHIWDNVDNKQAETGVQVLKSAVQDSLAKTQALSDRITINMAGTRMYFTALGYDIGLLAVPGKKEHEATALTSSNTGDGILIDLSETEQSESDNELDTATVESSKSPQISYMEDMFELEEKFEESFFTQMYDMCFEDEDGLYGMELPY